MRATVDYMQVYHARAVLGVLLEMEVSGVARIALRRFTRHIDKAIADIEPERMDMLKELAVLDEAGEPKLGPPNEQGAREYVFENGGRELFTDEFDKLRRAAKVSIECIEASVFENIHGPGVVSLMLQLGDLVFDPEEHDTQPERVKL